MSKSSFWHTKTVLIEVKKDSVSASAIGDDKVFHGDFFLWEGIESKKIVAFGFSYNGAITEDKCTKYKVFNIDKKLIPNVPVANAAIIGLVGMFHKFKYLKPTVIWNFPDPISEPDLKVIQEICSRCAAKTIILSTTDENWKNKIIPGKKIIYPVLLGSKRFYPSFSVLFFIFLISLMFLVPQCDAKKSGRKAREFVESFKPEK